MTQDPMRYAPLLDTLNSYERAQLEVTVREILVEVGHGDPDRIEAAADVFEDRALTHPDQEAAVVAMMIVAALREHALRSRSGIN